jgi:hypothetical protein
LANLVRNPPMHTWHISHITAHITYAMYYVLLAPTSCAVIAFNNGHAHVARSTRERARERVLRAPPSRRPLCFLFFRLDLARSRTTRTYTRPMAARRAGELLAGHLVPCALKAPRGRRS